MKASFRHPEFLTPADEPTHRVRCPIHGFIRWSDWLYAQIGRTDSIALARLAELLFKFLTGELKLDQKLIAETLWRDYQRAGRREKPEFLRSFIPDTRSDGKRTTDARANGLKRQSRHLGVAKQEV